MMLSMQPHFQATPRFYLTAAENEIKSERDLAGNEPDLNVLHAKFSAHENTGSFVLTHPAMIFAGALLHSGDVW